MTEGSRRGSRKPSGRLHAKLTSLSEPVAQERFEIGDRVDLLDRLLVIVIQPAERDPRRVRRRYRSRASGLFSEPVVEDHVAGAVVSVSRLAHRADVDEHLAF